MTGGRYLRLPRPWRAVLDVTAPQPAAYLAAMIDDALRYGMPARRRVGGLRAAVARRGLPTDAIASTLRRLPSKVDAEIERVVASLIGAWEELDAKAEGRLGPRPSHASALALERSAGTTVFIFGDAIHPLLVAKIGDRIRLERETTALSAAAVADIAPRPLGTVGDAHVQTGLAGRAFVIPAVDPAAAPRLPWSPPFAGLAEALGDLGAASASGEPSEDLLAALAAAADAPLSSRAAAALHAVRRDAARLPSVLQHGDTSAQNCLADRGAFTGIVDWEMARRGSPAFDLLNALVALLEHGVGLRRWSPGAVPESFAAAWTSAPLFVEGRKAARDAALAAGTAVELVESIEVAFLFRRVGRRVLHPSRYVVDLPDAVAMVEHACAS